ncbi:MAG: hypothetical protein WBW04_21080 [Nitrolancea sp.]
MSATLSKVQVDNRQLWCVCWQSPTRRSASYWYFEQEAEASAARDRLQSWEEGRPLGHDHGPRGTR